MLVSELMNRDVVTIGAGEACDEAVRRMTHEKIRHLPVLGEDGTLCGIITDRDLRHLLFTPEILGRVRDVPVAILLGERRVEDVMSRPAVCIGAAADVEEAAHLMRRFKVGALPVVEAGKVVGILTETDMFRHVLRAGESHPDLEVIVVSYP